MDLHKEPLRFQGTDRAQIFSMHYSFDRRQRDLYSFNVTNLRSGQSIYVFYFARRFNLLSESGPLI